MDSNRGNIVFDIKSSESGKSWDSSYSTKLRVMTSDNENKNKGSAHRVIGTIRKYPLIDLTVDDCGETDVVDKTEHLVLSSEAVNLSDANKSDYRDALYHTQTNHDKMELITSENYTNKTLSHPPQAKPSTTGEEKVKMELITSENYENKTLLYPRKAKPSTTEKFATLTLEGCRNVLTNTDKTSSCLNCYAPHLHSGVCNFGLQQQIKQNQQASLCHYKDAYCLKPVDIVKDPMSEPSIIDTYSIYPNTEKETPLSADRCMPPSQKRRCILPQSYPSSIEKNLSNQAIRNRHQWPSQILMEQKRAKESDVHDPKEERPRDSYSAANVVFRSTMKSPLLHREAVGYLKDRPVCRNMVQSDRSGSSSNSLPKTCQFTKEFFRTPNIYKSKETYDTRCGTVNGFETNRTEVNQLQCNDKCLPESRPVIQSGEPYYGSQNNKERLWPLTNTYNCYSYKPVENNEYFINITPEITNNDNGQPEDNLNVTSSLFSSFRQGPSINYSDSYKPTSTSHPYSGVDSTRTSFHLPIDKSVASNQCQSPVNLPNRSKQNSLTEEQSKISNNQIWTSRNTLERMYNMNGNQPSPAADFTRTLDATTKSVVIPHRPWHLSLAELIKSETSGTHEDISCNKDKHDVLQSAKSQMRGTQEVQSSNKNLKDDLLPEASTSPQENQMNDNQTDSTISTLDEDHAEFIKTIERQESIRRLKQLLQTKDAELSTLRSKRTGSSKAKSSTKRKN